MAWRTGDSVQRYAFRNPGGVLVSRPQTPAEREEARQHGRDFIARLLDIEQAIV